MTKTAFYLEANLILDSRYEDIIFQHLFIKPHFYFGLSSWFHICLQRYITGLLHGTNFLPFIAWIMQMKTELAKHLEIVRGIDDGKSDENS